MTKTYPSIKLLVCKLVGYQPRLGYVPGKGMRHCQYLKQFSIVLLFIAFSFHAFAQPANDDCTVATPIPIGSNGFALGTIISPQSDISLATLQTGETFAPSIIVAGLTKKSVWYKFSIPTTRSVRVSLLQPGSAIQAGNVGFTVYKTSTCIPGNAEISTKLSPIETFGSTFHPCVGEGEYYVQVTSNNNANGVVYVTVELTDGSPALYDKPATACQFGNLTLTQQAFKDVDLECQSIDDAAEVCLPATSFKDYTKSMWYTFTTPAYFDYLNTWFANISLPYGTPTIKVGYRIYQGDATNTPLTSLIQLGGCDSLMTDLYVLDKKQYKCGVLQPNTTYTVQLLFHKDFKSTIRFGVEWNGRKATNGPQPVSSLAAPNKMGTLSADNSTYGAINAISDVFGCNSLHSQNNCPKSMPAGGLMYNGYRFNLSSFVSFNLASTSSVFFSPQAITCSGLLLFRLYKQDLTANCTDLDTTNLLATFWYNAYQGSPLNCLAPGNYVLQVMGIDSTRPKNYYSSGSLYTTTNDQFCFNLGLASSYNLNIYVRTEVATNKFDLSAPGRFDKLNANGLGVMQPLMANTNYKATPDTLGCANTVLPDSSACELPKATYRQFILSDSVIIMNIQSSGYYGAFYKADADALATSQNKRTYPERISGLAAYTNCVNYQVSYAPYTGQCFIPGTYTYASFDNRLNQATSLKFDVATPAAKFNAPARAENIGDVLAAIQASGTTWIRSAIDTFSCYDNADTIDGKAPCIVNGIPATKMIYRQFYLSSYTALSIGVGDYYFPYYGAPGYHGNLTMFRGKATDGLGTLKFIDNKWSCNAGYRATNTCDNLEPGWYTVVSYGNGPSYQKPKAGSGNPGNIYNSTVGLPSAVYFTKIDACKAPKFNRPYKASVDTLTGQPYKIEWGPQTGSTAAYPLMGKTYVLNRENFDCTQDTAFIKQQINSCSNADAKVALYVFTTTQEAFVKITLPEGIWGSVYAFDVRTSDSSKLKNGVDTALQPCLNKAGRIDFCRLQPGSYTLVVFAPASYTCNTITPAIYIDQVGFSRFDHANNAYDFGAIQPDSVWYKGKPGDVNPLNAGRAPSNDFIYCTTGARDKDPASGVICYPIYNPNIYPSTINQVLHPSNAQVAYGNPYTDRRNLWYTFTIMQPGTVRVRAYGKTSTTKFAQDFAIYKSDEDGTLPFSTLKVQGLVDSTLLQGLNFVGNNYYYYCYRGYEEISIYNEPCNFKPTRYYVLVDQHFEDPLNIQVEVEVLLDSISANPPKFDHFSQANDLGVVNSGIKKGATDNFTCATKDLSDPLYAYTTCQKTLWYKFTTTVTGTVRYAAFFKNTNNWYYDHIQLFRQIKPNDSSSTGLLHLPYTTNYYNNGYWAQQCISPGTYYIILPGCNAVNEDVYPQIEIIPTAGDFCSAPMVTGLNGPGSTIVPVTVDCHTIGTDYGEFNPTLTCPAGAITNQYKTSWYRLDITGTDTLDITVFINEKTNATSTDIKYRLMTGTCGAMQEQSCVQDALTRNTYKCLAPGNSYYIQVFTPNLVNGTRVTGDIDLNISAVVHADTCLPASTCIGVANFTPQFDCTKDKDVVFTNFSTFGSSINYQWDFGYNGQTSNAVSPRFFYPALTTAQTYTVKLVLTNTLCGKKDSAIQTISIPPRPSVNLGNDTVICTNGATVTLDATSHTGSTYYWFNNGSTQPTITVGGVVNPIVEVTYNGCKARDTINIFVNPIAKRALQTKALCNITQVTLDASRGQGEQYQWNTGQSSASIIVSQPGVFWVDIYLRGCIVRDSFQVVSTSLRPLGNDTTFCQARMPYTADATISGATSYAWQNGSSSPTLVITKAGIYWVDINLGGCSFRDSLIVGVDSFKTTTATARICQGQIYTLPSGRTITTAGIYKDSLRNSRGCDSLISTITLAIDTVKTINSITSICAGQSYTLPSGKVVTQPGIYSDTSRNLRGCDSIIATIDVKVGTPIIKDTASVICKGQSYILPSGKAVNNTGLYRDSIKSVSGCDSSITNLTLRVDSAKTVISNAIVCAGKSYTLPSGKMVSTAGLYIDTVKNIRLCDSLISNITITIIPAQLKNTVAFICNGQSYTLPTGRVVSTAGTYQDTLRANTGCDSIVTSLQLTVYSAVQTNKAAFVCSGQNYMLPSGIIVTATGTYKDTIRYVNGCDSLRTTVNLVVYNKITNNIFISRCAGQPYTLPSGRVVNTTGIYLDTIRYSNGCDSLITTANLTVGSALTKTITASICAGQNYVLPSGLRVSNAGNYTDTVRTASGCDSVITQLTLMVDIATTAALNPALCNGGVFISPSGKSITLAGNYLDTIKNIRGCDSIRYTITLSILPVIKASKTDTICTGQTYTRPGGATVTIAGLYRDTLRTAAGCDSIINTTLVVRPPLSASASGNITICEGKSTSLSAIAGGGNGGPYTFNWGSAGSTATITVNPTVTTKYLVTITDGCTLLPAKDSVIVTVIPQPDSSFTLSAAAICAPAAIIFNATATSLRYKWDFGTGIIADTSAFRNPIFTYNNAGSYLATLTVTTPQGCTSSSSKTITANPTPKGGFAQPAPICAGSAVSFSGTVNNPVGISWSWNFGNGNTAALQNPAAQTYATAGNYVVRLIVTNAAGCADTTNRTLIVAPIPVPGLNNATEKICLGASVVLRAQGGTNYDWSPSLWLSDAASATPIATPLITTRYSVIVTNATGCKATDSVLVQVAQPFVLIAPKDTFVCAGGTVQLMASGALTYLWSGKGLSSTTVANPIAKPNDTTTYSVTGYGENNCFTQTATFTINYIPLPTVEAGNDTTVLVGSSFALLPQYGPGITDYRWSPPTYLGCTTCPYPITTPRAAITYNITVSNAFKCEASDSRVIKLLCTNESIFIPNTFTPNGDGANDVFYPRGEGIKSVRFLRVYNRWGQLIFERLNFSTNDRSQGWDGTYKGEKLAPDVYVYSLGMVCDNGQIIDTKGNVMIVR
ncbi:MAG: PKD domain-containing protein [Mucilaginibacter sp.]